MNRLPRCSRSWLVAVAVVITALARGDNAQAAVGNDACMNIVLDATAKPLVLDVRGDRSIVVTKTGVVSQLDAGHFRIDIVKGGKSVLNVYDATAYRDVGLSSLAAHMAGGLFAMWSPDGESIWAIAEDGSFNVLAEDLSKKPLFKDGTLRAPELRGWLATSPDGRFAYAAAVMPSPKDPKRTIDILVRQNLGTQELDLVGARVPFRPVADPTGERLAYVDVDCAAGASANVTARVLDFRTSETIDLPEALVPKLSPEDVVAGRALAGLDWAQVPKPTRAQYVFPDGGDHLAVGSRVMILGLRDKTSPVSGQVTGVERLPLGEAVVVRLDGRAAVALCSKHCLKVPTSVRVEYTAQDATTAESVVLSPPEITVTDDETEILASVSIARAPAPRPAALSRVCKAFDGADCEKQCAIGQRDSCLVLGRMHRDGNRAQKSRDKALASFKAACDAGLGRACTEYGDLKRWLATPDSTDAKEAAAAYRQACEQGDADGCFHFGESIPKDPQNRRMYLVKSCDGGSIDGCRSLAGEQGRDTAKMGEFYAKVLSLRAAACDAGDASECMQLASKYNWRDTPMMPRALQMVNSEGAKTDPHKVKSLVAKAVEVFNRGCDAGDMKACNALGELLDPANGYMGSIKPKSDPTGAMRAYQRACEGDFGPACANAAARTKDKVKALALEVRACDLLDGDGCAAAARDYVNGKGTKKDARVARELFIKACASGWTGSGDVMGDGLDPDEFECPR